MSLNDNTSKIADILAIILTVPKIIGLQIHTYWLYTQIGVKHNEKKRSNRAYYCGYKH